MVPWCERFEATIKALVCIVDCILDLFSVHGDYFDNTKMVGVWSLAVVVNCMLGYRWFAQCVPLDHYSRVHPIYLREGGSV